MFRKQLIPKEKMAEIAKAVLNTLTIEEIKVLYKRDTSQDCNDHECFNISDNPNIPYKWTDGLDWVWMEIWMG